MQLDILADTKAMCRVCMSKEFEHPADLYDASPFGLPIWHEMLRVICPTVFIKSEAAVIMLEKPTKVCLMCQNAIVAAYNLHQQCIETDRRLNELVALMWELREPGGDEVVGDCGDPVTSSSKKEILPVNVEQTYEISEQNPTPSNSAAGKTCAGCSKIFATRSSLQRHQRRGICGKPIPKLSGKPTTSTTGRTCFGCGRIFATRSSLNRHQIRGHCVKIVPKLRIPRKNSVADRTCSDCGKIFATRSSMTRHKRYRFCDMTQDPKQRTCDICNKVMQSVQVLKRHRQMHDSIDAAKQAKSDDLSQALNLPATTQEQPSEGDRLVEMTPLINTDMIKVEALDLMDEDETEEDSIQTIGLQCTDCGVSFSSKRALRVHKQEGSCQRKKIFPCSICGKIFDSQTRMFYHRRNHRERVACSQCHDLFRNRVCLYLHIKRKRCRGSKLRKPQDFSQGFGAQNAHTSSAGELEHHEGQYQIKQSEHEKQCTNCGATFLSKRTLKVHMDEGKCFRGPIFPCTICGKTFDKLTRMRYHRSHHQQRTTCPHCGQTYRNRACLQIHIKRNCRHAAGLVDPLLNSEALDVIKTEEPEIKDAEEMLE